MYATWQFYALLIFYQLIHTIAQTFAFLTAKSNIMEMEKKETSTEVERPVSEKSGQNPRRLIKELLVFLRHRLSLEEDNADPQETIDYIRKGIEFRGTNVWILVFAIFVASIGLNMNSAAVIIGAMLISPLMGPIMGIGMGIGINDFELIKKAAKNLGLMVGISVATSSLYFFLSPISDAQSELLARTQPTIWDVLIALFGGLAGIVAGSRKEKSNAIPGVAIATALMPPLCTAGFGLATGNMSFFRSVLSIHDKFSVYQFVYHSHCAVFAISAKRICGCKPRKKGQKMDSCNRLGGCLTQPLHCI